MFISRRLFLRSLSRLGMVDKCPPPTFDSGCTYCGVPDFPADMQIDFNKELNGTMASHWKHVLIISSGQTHDQWPSKIELVPGSLANSLSFLKRTLGSPYHPVMISNIDVGIVPDAKYDNTVLVYPESKLINFNHEQTDLFFKKYLIPNEEKVELPYNPFKQMMPEKERAGEEEEEVEVEAGEIVESSYEKNLITICGHKNRDIRCGLLAPLLKAEFDKVLKLRKLHSNIDTGYISHVGGHAYAGNVIMYDKKFKHSVWYGRVLPESVQGLIEETIVKGNIVKELYRGL